VEEIKSLSKQSPLKSSLSLKKSASKKIAPVKFLVEQDSKEPNKNSTNNQENDKSKSTDAAEISQDSEGNKPQESPKIERKANRSSSIRKTLSNIKSQNFINKLKNADSDPPTEESSDEEEDASASDISVEENDGNYSDIFPFETFEPNFDDVEEQPDLIEATAFLKVHF
jgi:hypothetical protein